MCCKVEEDCGSKVSKGDGAILLKVTVRWIETVWWASGRSKRSRMCDHVFWAAVSKSGQDSLILASGFVSLLIVLPLSRSSQKKHWCTFAKWFEACARQSSLYANHDLPEKRYKETTRCTVRPCALVQGQCCLSLSPLLKGGLRPFLQKRHLSVCPLVIASTLLGILSPSKIIPSTAKLS